jgi:glycine oxidase
MTPQVGGEASVSRMLHADVAVIGGGIIGHGIAWEARQSGRTVVLIDDAPGSGASWAAAGMLAPVSELHYQEEDLLELMLEASELWPAFAAGLAPRGQPLNPEQADTGYLTTSTLAVGADAADRRALADLRCVQRASGLEVEPLTVREARSREPLLSPGISCAFDIPADHQVDPRRLLARIAAALAAHAGQGDAGQGHSGQGHSGQATPRTSRVPGAMDGYAVRERATGLLWEDGRVSGVSLAGGAAVHAGETVVANGLEAVSLSGLPGGLKLPLRPVYGDILRLRVPDYLRPLLTSTVRGMVHGVPVYIVPRRDGTVVIGASQREDALSGSDGAVSGPGRNAAPSTAVSAGGVYQLLRDAQVLVPAVAELELLESTARARPATPDNAPLLGRVAAGGNGPDIAGLIIATGFFRHGVLLTPAAASLCRQLMDGTGDRRWAAFRPDRFSPGQQRSGPRPEPSVTTDPNKETA